MWASRSTRQRRLHPAEEAAVDAVAGDDDVAPELVRGGAFRLCRLASPPGHPIGERRRDVDQQWRDQESEHGDRQQCLERLGGQQPVLATDLHQDERELADLRQAEPEDDRDARRIADETGGDPGGEGLDQHDDQAEAHQHR